MYIDKKTESDIKAVKGFLEFWDKFRSIFKEIISKDTISKDDEGKFLETKDMIRAKYEELKNALDYKYMPHGRLTDPVMEILTLGGVHFISEKNLKRLNDNWKDSYIFLNNILERLENRKRRLGQFNAFGVFMKKVLERR